MCLGLACLSNTAGAHGHVAAESRLDLELNWGELRNSDLFQNLIFVLFFAPKAQNHTCLTRRAAALQLDWPIRTWFNCISLLAPSRPV